MKSILRIALLLLSVVLMSSQASATCTCEIAPGNAQPIIVTLKNYLNLQVPEPTTASSCHQACINAMQPPPDKLTMATIACSSSVPNGTNIRAFSRNLNPLTGQNYYLEAGYIGKLVNTPAVTTTSMVCPTSWYSNAPSAQLGGATTDGRCKKQAGTLSLPPPLNGTQIQGIVWGFTWGNEVWAYSSATNGGAPTQHTTTTPAVCAIQ